MEWMKLHCLNLLSGWTMASTTPGVKISPQKGHGMGHVIVFGIKPCFLNFANESTMDSATPWAKNSPQNGFGVGHMTTV